MVVSAIKAADDLEARIRKVIRAPAALHEPDFPPQCWSLVKDCLDTRWVSSVGKYVDQFEAMLCEATGSGSAIAMVNGTSALQLALQLSGVQSGDEVLVPSLTFIATVNSISYLGAHAHFVDSSPIDFGICSIRLANYLEKIVDLKNGECFNKRTGRKIRALVPVHIFGHSCDLDGLAEICDRFGLVLIEDATEALGSRYKGQHVGLKGKMAVLSFNGNKIITTGGGGAILTSDQNLARRAKHLTNQAKLPHAWEYIHDEIGYNFRLPNINAALGCGQLAHLPTVLEKKRHLAILYRDAFRDCDIADFCWEPEYSKSNFWLNAIRLKPEYQNVKDEILRTLNERGIGSRPVWNLIHTLAPYRETPRMDLFQAEELARSLINIPSSAFLVQGS